MTNAEIDIRLSKIEKTLAELDISDVGKNEFLKDITSIIEDKINDSYASLQSMFDARLENLTSKLEAKIEQEIISKLETFTK